MSVGDIVYLVGVAASLLYLLRFIVPKIVDEVGDGDDDAVIRVLGVVFSIFVCWMWPLALPAYLAYQIVPKEVKK